MDGLYFALGNLTICLVLFWAMANDRAQPTGPTSGLLAMRDDEPNGKTAPKPFQP